MKSKLITIWKTYANFVNSSHMVCQLCV